MDYNAPESVPAVGFPVAGNPIMHCLACDRFRLSLLSTAGTEGRHLVLRYFALSLVFRAVRCLLEALG